VPRRAAEPARRGARPLEADFRALLPEFLNGWLHASWMLTTGRSAARPIREGGEALGLDIAAADSDRGRYRDIESSFNVTHVEGKKLEDLGPTGS
jgi:hypothetical protein